MHYYKRNIGDYHKKAGRLTILQHGVYTLLMDAIYDREKFPTLEEALDWCWASTDEETQAVRFVLRKFFIETEGVFIQNRMQEEIDEYHGKCEKNAKNGKLGGRPKGSKNKQKKTQSVSKKTQTVQNKTETKANESLTNNHKPITNNQEPLVKDIEGAKRTSIPYEEIKSLYNSICLNLPAVKVLTDKRKAAIKKLWNSSPDYQSKEYFKSYFYTVNQIDFLNGFNNRGWKADLEWLVNTNNHVKVIEGKYQVTNPISQIEQEKEQGREDFLRGETGKPQGDFLEGEFSHAGK